MAPRPEAPSAPSASAQPVAAARQAHSLGAPLELVPRFAGQGYRHADLAARRVWLEGKTGTQLPLIGSYTMDSLAMRGNIENPIGAAQVPVAIAGPLRVLGEHACGTFYVPLATTEGAIVRSYERGMVALTRSGGVEARVLADENRASPVFLFADIVAAQAFTLSLPDLLPEMRAATAATTRHGKLLRVEPYQLGRKVIVALTFSTGDAHGMNMVVKATERICGLLAERSGVQGYRLLTGHDSEKRASGAALAGGKGKRVTAGVRLPREVLRTVLRTDAGAMAELAELSAIGHLQAAALGRNGQIANCIAALFIACGQDVANVANAALAITQMEAMPDGDLFASVTLFALTVATVGGGTSLGTGRECLEILGCHGAGKARKLAEIVAATALAGELSMTAAIAAGEFVVAHETYGRNRPEPRSP
jgi:hydroxymethylglutaryl-CoA reductase (NADPH)